MKTEKGTTALRPQLLEATHRAAMFADTFDLESRPMVEEYDLVVVGAGISGLSAALFYRERFGEDKRTLVLDSFPHLGGHAKRVEFEVDGRHLVSYGGSEGIISPKEWNSDVVKDIFARYGIDLARWDGSDGFFLQDLYPPLGMSRGSFFDREHFGVDRLVKGDFTLWPGDDLTRDRKNARPIGEFIGDFPLSESARAELVALWTKSRVTLDHMSEREREAYLDRTSYKDFLVGDWGLSEEALSYLKQRPYDWFALPLYRIPALEARLNGYPGFEGVQLPGERLAEYVTDPYIYHFPDGVASIPRLLARDLIPGLAPGSSVEDVVSARFDDAALDRPENAVRIRLSSTVVRLANDGDVVEVGYLSRGRLHRVRGSHCVFAAWNVLLPHLMPELDGEQREALKDAAKLANAYTKVAVRNWRPFVELGVHDVYSPAAFFSRVKLDYPVSMGEHRFPTSPDEPIVLQLGHTPVPEEEIADPIEAGRIGQKMLLDTTDEMFELRVREQLDAILSPGGFDAERDIAGIVVNRWTHAYAPSYNPLFHDEIAYEQETLAARAPVGRVAVANGDSERSGSLQSSIDAAARAVRELPKA